MPHAATTFNNTNFFTYDIHFSTPCTTFLHQIFMSLMHVFKL